MTTFHKCDYCGEEYSVRPHKLEKNKYNFCSTDCRVLFQAKSLTEIQEEILTIMRNLKGKVTQVFLESLGYSRGCVRNTLDKLQNLGYIRNTWLNGRTKAYYVLKQNTGGET